MPSSQRYFQEIFWMSMNILDNYGERNSSLFLKRRSLVITHIEPDYCLGLDYFKPRLKADEVLFICYVNDNEEKQFSLGRRKENNEFLPQKTIIIDLKNEKSQEQNYS
jgi:hypothetical protein